MKRRRVSEEGYSHILSKKGHLYVADFPRLRSLNFLGHTTRRPFFFSCNQDHMDKNAMQGSAGAGAKKHKTKGIFAGLVLLVPPDPIPQKSSPLVDS